MLGTVGILSCTLYRVDESRDQESRRGWLLIVLVPGFGCSVWLWSGCWQRVLPGDARAALAPTAPALLHEAFPEWASMRCRRSSQRSAVPGDRMLPPVSLNQLTA
jgi:hypothetical protein